MKIPCVKDTTMPDFDPNVNAKKDGGKKSKEKGKKLKYLSKSMPGRKRSSKEKDQSAEAPDQMAGLMTGMGSRSSLHSGSFHGSTASSTRQYYQESPRTDQMRKLDHNKRLKSDNLKENDWYGSDGTPALANDKYHSDASSARSYTGTPRVIRVEESRQEVTSPPHRPPAQTPQIREPSKATGNVGSVTVFCNKEKSNFQCLSLF